MIDEIEVDTRGGPTTGPFYEDAEGFNTPEAPGTGSRRIPRGDFPTGVDVGQPLPNIVATDQTVDSSTCTRTATVNRLWWCSTGQRCGDGPVAPSWSSWNEEWTPSERLVFDGTP